MDFMLVFGMISFMFAMFAVMIIAMAFKPIRDFFMFKRANKNKDKVILAIVGKAGNITYKLASLNEDYMNTKTCTYIIEKDAVCYHNGAPYLFYNQDDGVPLKFRGLVRELDSEFVDNILVKAKMAAQSKGMKTQMMMLYACLGAVGAAIVACVLVFKLQVDMDEALRLLGLIQATLA